MTTGDTRRQRAGGFLASIIDPRAWLHLLRLVHYFNYTHVRELRKVSVGAGARISPNVSLVAGERITIGARSHIGARDHLWAGPTTSRITIGEDALFGPDVMLTAANYGTVPGEVVSQQPMLEADIVIGRDVWLGAKVVVVAGVTIGDGCVVGAGSVVTRDLPPGAIAVGAPARAVACRATTSAS
jgi:acetyltransferase-like isoleucine patch superfamily enzyme